MHFYLPKNLHIELPIFLHCYFLVTELKKEFFSLIELTELGSPKAEKLKKDWENTIKIIEQNKEKKRSNEVIKIDVYELLIKDLENFELNKSASIWYKFFKDLTLNNSSVHYGDELNSDIQSLPGWQFVDELLKQRIVKLSKYFIENFNENYIEWFGKNTIYMPAFAGYKSLILLCNIESTYIENLDSHFWRKWMYILMEYPESFGISGKDKTYLRLIQIAYKIIPNELTNILIEKITIADHNDETHLTFLQKVDLCMDSNLQDVFLAKVKENTFKPISQFNIYLKLLEKGNINAFISIKNSIQQSQGDLKIQLTSALASFCNSEDWGFIMNEIIADKFFGQQFFLSFLNTYIVSSTPILKRINEVQCAELFIWLHDNFPKEEDPKFEEAHFVGPREKVGEFRNQILGHLTNKGTNQSIEALSYILIEKPILDLKFYLVEAKKNFRKSNWRPLKPKDLFSLVINKSRLILGADDLLNIIIDALKRIEVRLQGDNSLSILLWDSTSQPKKEYKPKSEEILSDYIKHQLEYELRTNGISIYREVQLRKPKHIVGGNEGEKTDIYVSFTHPNTRKSFNGIVEVKGSWNNEVNSSMEKQLKDRYLKVGNCVHGLYLVGWYTSGTNDKKNNKTGLLTLEEAKLFYSNEAKRLSTNGKTIKSFVLDCSLKN